ncbi:winged helix DNA-binding domain-containing protein [Kitasatospora paracochleata]|uniref:Winged helix DNA-binding protein n=1 Tax=Kitasatospora paracochleata TaxID=58354 RepID=A0ABT1IVG6_9ACTN|nr:winged helix DNA-binding domain-containing protein [Kitasatospora paracochleata]MCP2308606.1 hypothetical protein [Kitasatospora paracochleata]
MTARPRIDDEQRRARLGVRHLLAPAHRADRTEDVAGAVVALHATDPSTVFLSVAARLRAPSAAPTEQALYEDDTLVRMHGMRHTLFVVDEAAAPVVHSSTTLKVAARERRSMLAAFAAAGLDAGWTARVEDRTLAALADAGEATGARLGTLVPELRQEIPYGVGTSYATTQSVSMRLLRVLGMEGAIVRRRPVGSWTSSQHQWALHRPYPPLPVADAQAALAARWLASYGPATAEDLKWWTGWGVREVRAALAACDAVAVELEDGGEGYVLPGDAEAVAAPAEPWAALLPSLDPTAMGWQQRDWYFGAALRGELVDRSGNIGPTVWWNGRIVGGWAQRADGEIVWELLGAEADAASVEAAVAVEAERLRGWVGDVRITPRFRTPLERRLSS